jgi:hypothetical protein
MMQEHHQKACVVGQINALESFHNINVGVFCEYFGDD